MESEIRRLDDELAALEVQWRTLEVLLVSMRDAVERLKETVERADWREAWDAYCASTEGAD